MQGVQSEMYSHDNAAVGEHFDSSVVKSDDKALSRGVDAQSTRLLDDWINIVIIIIISTDTR